MEDLIRYLKQEKLLSLSKENLYKSKHKNFDYEFIEDVFAKMEGKSFKYKDIEEILLKYSENPYSKRRVVYYIEKGLLPETNKTSFNQAEYEDYHVGMFLLIDQMQEVYKIDEIHKLIMKISKCCKYIDFGKLLKYYYWIILNNNIVNQEIKELLSIIEDKPSNKNKDLNGYELELINSIIEASNERMKELSTDEKEKMLKNIYDVIFSIKYLAYVKYFLSVFEKYSN